MTKFVDILYTYLNSIDVDYKNFEYDENDKNNFNKLYKYNITEFNDNRCILRYSFISNMFIEVYMFNKTFSNHEYYISKMYIGYINIKRKEFVYNLMYDKELLEEAFNYRHFMIEFFSAFEIRNDGICYMFDNIFICFANNYLIITNSYSNKQINIKSIDEFVEKFPEIYDYKKEFTIKTIEL
jgi:hypothetical protein